MKGLFKIFTSAILLSSLIFFSRCSEEDISFSFPINDVDACLPSGTKDFWQWETVSRADIEGLFAQYGFTYDPSSIVSVTLDSAIVELLSPSGGNFDDIVVFDLYFRETGATGNGTKVAYVTNIASSSATVKLESQFSELAEFLDMDSFEAGLHINRDPADAAKCITGSVTLQVTVSGG